MRAIHLRPVEFGAMQVYVRSMGKLFRLLAVFNDMDATNKFCEAHDGAGVIAEDVSGNIYVAAIGASESFNVRDKAA